MPTAFSDYFRGIDNCVPLIPESLIDANIIIAINTETWQILLVYIPQDYDLAFSGMHGDDTLCNCSLHSIQTVLDLSII